MMNIEPLGKRVLVRFLPPQTKTKGGIVIPETADDNSPWKRAEIAETGPDVEKLEKGQKVLLNNVNPRTIIKEASGDQRSYAILMEDNVQARIRED
jgi:co-chaperonin GroES (HSP10)